MYVDVQLPTYHLFPVIIQPFTIQATSQDIKQASYPIFQVQSKMCFRPEWSNSMIEHRFNISAIFCYLGYSINILLYFHMNSFRLIPVSPNCLMTHFRLKAYHPYWVCGPSETESCFDWPMLFTVSKCLSFHYTVYLRGSLHALTQYQ